MVMKLGWSVWCCVTGVLARAGSQRLCLQRHLRRFQLMPNATKISLQSLKWLLVWLPVPPHLLAGHERPTFQRPLDGGSAAHSSAQRLGN
jgi:hypothetical protein